MKKLIEAWNNALYTRDNDPHKNKKKPSVTSASSPFQNGLVNGSSANINASLTKYAEEDLDDLHNSSNKDLSNGEGVEEVNLAWNHMHMWASKYQPDLYDALSDPCRERDLILAQKELKVTFPQCVIRSMSIHDGQEVTPDFSQGFIFGLELMDLNSVVKMTHMWRKVSERQRNEEAHKVMMNKLGDMSQPQLSHTNTNNLTQASRANNSNDQETQNVMVTPGRKNFNYNNNNNNTDKPKQFSIPPGAVSPVYAHPYWIPLLTDNAGNHVGIDLAPESQGKWGQVIIFGRDFDTKYVIAPNWGDFLLIFANDLESKNWRIEGDGDDVVNNGGEVIFNDRFTKKDQVYLSVLTERSLKLYQKAQLLKKEEKIIKPPPLRTPDLIDDRSPIVNEVEVFLEPKVGPTIEKSNEEEKDKAEEKIDDETLSKENESLGSEKTDLDEVILSKSS